MAGTQLTAHLDMLWELDLQVGRLLRALGSGNVTLTCVTADRSFDRSVEATPLA